ncbi:hypothetical protein [Laspinema palackyanum]
MIQHLPQESAKPWEYLSFAVAIAYPLIGQFYPICTPIKNR